MGRYELLFRIASGGMAEVYAARVLGEAGFQKLVALKRMLPTIADDEEFVTMFLDEARVAANISSPYVVQTLDLGRDKADSLYIVMELVVGVTLSRIMKNASKVRRAVPVSMAIELLRQAALGLDAAHEARTPIGEPLHIVHRDVSPQNILIGVDGRVRLTDFGVARAVMRMTKTDAGRIKGKFAYCAPEQLRVEDIDRRADIFALGVVAWECLAGQRLFVADHPLATMERVQSMPIVPLDQIRSKVPKEVSDVVLWALERDPDKRPETAIAFAQALSEAGRNAGIKQPSGAQVGKFIQAAGGEPLTKIQSNIRVALSATADEIEEPTKAFQIIDEESQSAVSMPGTAVEHDNERSQPEPDASGVSRVPGSVIPPELPSPNRKPIFAALAGIGLIAAGAGAYIFATQPTPVVEPMGSAAPSEAAQEPVAQDPVAQDPVAEDAADPAAAQVPEQADEPEVITPEAAPIEAEDEPLAEGEEALEASPTVMGRPRRGRPSRMVAAMVSPMTSATAAEAATMATEAPTAPPMEAAPRPRMVRSTMQAASEEPSSMMAPSRMNGLFGLDAFNAGN